MAYSPSSVISVLPTTMRVRLQYPVTTGKTVDAGRATVSIEQRVALYGEDAMKVHSYYVDTATLGATPTGMSRVVIDGTSYVIRAVVNYPGTLMRLDVGQQQY